MDQKEFEKFIIFIAFANSLKHPLAELKDEFYKICEIISEFAARRNHPIFLQPYGEISIEGLSKTISRYHDLLYLFHFSGHANESILQLKDKNADGHSLAGLFERAVNLKLVFLNGCATQGHVKRMMQANIPAVIATHAKVEDRAASLFSELFYYEFISKGRRLEEAFIWAKQRFNLDNERKREDIAIRDTANGFEDYSDDPVPWGLYLNPLYERNQILDWQIGKTYPFSKILQQTSNKMSKNPYIVGSPIRDTERFFGRENILSYILETSSLGLCILGVRRIGKTSLLRQAEIQYAIENQKIAIYLSLQSLKTAEDIGREFIRSIRRLISKHSIMSNFSIPEEYIHINEILLKWVEFCNKHNLSSLLLLDEAEELINLSSRDLADFRAIFDREPLISLVLTGSRFLRKLKINELLPVGLLNTLEVRILSVFNEKEASKLISQNDQVQVDVTTLNEVQQLSGQHPFLIQYLANKLFKDGRLNQIDLTSNLLTLSNDLSSILEDEFSRLTASEQMILWELSFTETTSFQQLQQTPNIQQNKLRQDLLELEHLGFIRCNQHQYFLSNIFWQQYLDSVRLVKTPTQQPIIYISHHENDDKYLKKLKIHLAATKATLRDFNSFSIGSQIDQSLEAEISRANIIILLLSPDYIVNPQKIAERNLIKSSRSQANGVIPILVRPCAWEEEFGNIQILPQDRKPLSSKKDDLDHTLNAITKAVSFLL